MPPPSISFNGVGKIYRVDDTVNSTKYIKILEDVLLDGMTKQGLSISNHIFIQDNAPCYTSKATKEWFKTQHLNVLDWPDNIPDMNIIENVWGYLDQKVREKEDEILDSNNLFRIIEKE